MIDPYPAQEEMIRALQDVGVEVRPVMKAIIVSMRDESGHPIVAEEMHISDAYRKLVNRGRLNLDPFADK